MKSIVVDAPAKINLSLDITGIRENGYHNIDTVMQSVGLCDTVTISRMSGQGLYISCNQPRIPCDETNYAHIAASRFFERFGRPDTAISIDIQKRIPSEAGLAGGSADAAGVLVGLNGLLDVGADVETLCGLGLTVGADVPFCIMGGTRRARGVGEEFSILPALPPCHILIAKPAAGISTAESYRRYDRSGARRRPDTDRLVHCLEQADLQGLAKGMYNVLSEVAELPAIEEIRAVMLACGALGAMMTGSGSAVFGLFTSRGQAKHCLRKLYGLAEGVFLTRPVGYGAVVLDMRT